MILYRVLQPHLVLELARDYDAGATALAGGGRRIFGGRGVVRLEELQEGRLAPGRRQLRLRGGRIRDQRRNLF